MAVMKVCCGCMSTRSGTFFVLLLYMLAYIAGITFLAIALDKGWLLTWYTDYAITDFNCAAKEEFKDAWWCTSMVNLPNDLRTWTIVLIVVLAFFLVFDLVALFATGRGTYWPLMPWIILEFVRLAATTVALVIVLILWGVYMTENDDTSLLIATGVLGVAVIFWFFYMWLCVVSYFQILREIDKVTQMHTVQTSPTHHKVTPFVRTDSYDKENPYDNLSEHTTKESLDDDTVSIKSGVKSPIKAGSVVDVKTAATAEANE